MIYLITAFMLIHLDANWGWWTLFFFILSFDLLRNVQ